ncbi:MAG TPA: Gfo/Idh/MocA family oxidoreductase [Verrucomicrobiae bacterium]|jgi:predicted dehydrogenase|nr:Gfo/Idh/MocA family oxidoreductase [Verrucomicrobiae bacterium]
MSQTKLRWGILGTANIARKNWLAIRNTGNSSITAVASRERERSREFVESCQRGAPFVEAPLAFGSYEELLASPDVDAVYIPLPTGLRKQWVIRAAKAGKHIVCEKPCATSLADLREMTEACRRNKVQFMDGVMFMHSKRLDQIRTVLDDGESIGALRRMMMGFTFWAEPEFFTDNIRAHSALEPAGCLGDLGWYCIRFALWAMRWQMPVHVTGRMLTQSSRPDSPAPVPTEFSGELLFDGGVSAGFYCSFVTANQQWVQLSGTKGCLLVSDFVLPFFGSEVVFDVNNASFEVVGCEFNMEPRTRRLATAEYSNSHPSAQETNLFRNFADQVRSGRIQEDWISYAVKTQEVMQACLASAQRP